MIRFIHTADIHLDSPLLKLEQYEGAPADRLRGAVRRAFENLVDLALSEKVQFVLIAGDLYDGDWRDYNTGLFFVRQMARLKEAGIRVFIVAGNHDAASTMTKSLRLPANAFMFPTDRPFSTVMDDIGVAIHGQGFASRAVTKDLSIGYPTAFPGYFNIGILHTCATGGRAGHEEYAPCTMDGLLSKEYDYWALGHIHQKEILHENPPIVFPGNIQGRKINETGPRGCMLVSYDGVNAFSINFVPLDVIRWQKTVIDMDHYPDIGDPYQLVDEIAERLQSSLSEADGRALAVRIEVCGPTALHGKISADPQRWENEVRRAALEAGGGDVWVEKVNFLTVPEQEWFSLETAERLPAENPVVETLQCLKKLKNDPQMTESLKGALSDFFKKLPPELTSGEDSLSLDRPGAIEKVLEQAGPMLLKRLLREGKAGGDS